MSRAAVPWSPCVVSGCNKVSDKICHKCGTRICVDHILRYTIANIWVCKPCDKKEERRLWTECNTSGCSLDTQYAACMKDDCWHQTVLRCYDCKTPWCATHLTKQGDKSLCPSCVKPPSLKCCVDGCKEWILIKCRFCARRVCGTHKILIRGVVVCDDQTCRAVTGYVPGRTIRCGGDNCVVDIETVDTFKCSKCNGYYCRTHISTSEPRVCVPCAKAGLANFRPSWEMSSSSKPSKCEIGACNFIPCAKCSKCKRSVCQRHGVGDSCTTCWETANTRCVFKGCVKSRSHLDGRCDDHYKCYYDGCKRRPFLIPCIVCDVSICDEHSAGTDSFSLKCLMCAKDNPRLDISVEVQDAYGKPLSSTAPASVPQDPDEHDICEAVHKTFPTLFLGRGDNDYIDAIYEQVELPDKHKTKRWMRLGSEDMIKARVKTGSVIMVRMSKHLEMEPVRETKSGKDEAKMDVVDEDLPPPYAP